MIASTEMVEANHRQNRSAGLPLRSASAMTLMPFASMTPAGLDGAGAAGSGDGDGDAGGRVEGEDVAE